MPEQRFSSRELSHFVGRGRLEEEQYALLLKILREGWLTHPPHRHSPGGNIVINLNAMLSRNELYSPEVVCFCDIPVADIAFHAAKYSKFGLSFSKDFIAAHNGAPVFYLAAEALARFPTRPDGEWWPRGGVYNELLNDFHRLFEDARQAAAEPGAPPLTAEWSRLRGFESFLIRHVFAFFKAFDHRLPDDSLENYYLEREWRVIGNLEFNLADVERVFLPRAFKERFRDDLPAFCGQLSFLD